MSHLGATLRDGEKGGDRDGAGRRTGAAAAKAASKVLRDRRTGKASKTAAASALSQRAPRKAK
jgi:hypothetical protein